MHFLNKMQLSKIKPKTKKGITELTPSIITLSIAAIVLVISLVILQEMRDTRVDGSANCNATSVSACGTAYEAANNTITGVATFGDFWVIIVLGIVAVVVIGLLLRSFGNVRAR